MLANRMITIGSRQLDLSCPVVMGIVNVTPDSFFADSRTTDADAVRERVRRVVNEGAAIVDILSIEFVPEF